MESPYNRPTAKPVKLRADPRKERMQASRTFTMRNTEILTAKKTRGDSQNVHNEGKLHVRVQWSIGYWKKGVIYLFIYLFVNPYPGQSRKSTKHGRIVQRTSWW